MLLEILSLKGPPDGEPRDRLVIHNYLQNANAHMTFTTSTGLIIPLERGRDIFLATVNKLDDSGVLVPTPVRLFEYFNQAVLDELRDYLVSVYQAQLTCRYVEGESFEIRDASSVEEYAEVNLGPSKEYQNSFHLTYTRQTDPRTSIKIGITKKGNQPLKQLEQQALNGLDSAARSLGLYDLKPFGDQDEMDVAQAAADAVRNHLARNPESRE